MNDNPLVQALKNKQGPKSNSDAILEFILAHFNLVPKDDQEEKGEDNPEMVMTQESHTP